MKFLFALLIWLGMGAVMVAGIILAVKGSLWLLIASLVGFVIAVGKIACLHH